jgi:hypothetical protein
MKAEIPIGGHRAYPNHVGEVVLLLSPNMVGLKVGGGGHRSFLPQRRSLIRYFLPDGLQELETSVTIPCSQRENDSDSLVVIMSAVSIGNAVALIRKVGWI